MPNILVVSVLIFLLASCGDTTKSSISEETHVSSPFQAFPQGYQYMERNEALTKAVETGDRSVVREHGWYLWAGMMQPAKGLDWPIWYTWPNTKAAFSNDGKVQLLESKTSSRQSSSMIARNIANKSNVFVKGPEYLIPDYVLNEYKGAICTDRKRKPTICDGSHFLFNGDIMIPTESLSQEAMDWIRAEPQPLNKKSTLDTLHSNKVPSLEAPQRYIVTKHMYWPIKANQLSAIPVWRNDHDRNYPDYAGYETWKTLIAIDTTGKQTGETVNVKFLYGVNSPAGKQLGPIAAQAKVYPLHDFYHHKVTPADWNTFDEADKAILNASSYWAYNQPFGPGDYLVTIAMHINTKEIYTWALQSAWWSDQPNEGAEAANRPDIPYAVGPWKHYKLVDSYGIPDSKSGTLPVATNPYIELVIHPVATNCHNCHVRAGWPTGKNSGQASYQNSDCPLLLDHLTPKSECLKDLLLTDFQWIVPDRAN